MGTKPENLFADLPGEMPGELVEVLAEGEGSVRIERIVSRGHASPAGFWYDQGEHEWVILLSGSARLRFEGEDQPVSLAPGDWLEIPAGCRHRVEATADDQATVWLAVFFGGSSDDVA